MSANVSMSTGWNAKRHARAETMVEEIMGLGIDIIEAGYAMRPEQLAELAALLPRGRFRVNSVHNFCPTPPEHKCNWGDDYLLSSPDEDKRRSGIQAVLQTVAWAKELHARVIVVHLGQVEMDRGFYQTIKQLLGEGRRGSEAHRAAVEGLREERARLAGPFFDAARRTLDELLPALPPGIILGIESRYEHFALPNLEEMELLLREYGPALGYWHDIGHAHVQEYMGFYEQDEYIRTLHHGLVGMHIHDALGISDHRAPGYGEIDFERSVKPYLRDEVLKVLEFHPRVPYEEAVQGIQRLRKMGII
ncbi:MAG: sugar phosphate isomerase/epimerase family protein [Bacteroidota bacterium]